MVHLRRGVDIYRIPSDGEFDSAIYGPLSYLVGSAVINPTRPAYLPLRLLSFFSTISLVTLGGIFAFKLAGRKLAPVLAVLLLLSSAYLARYGISARADMVALFLAFSGFLVFYCYRDSRRALIIAAMLMLLSFFYKQQFVGAPIAVITYLILTRQFQRVFLFGGTLAAGGVVLIGIFSFVLFPHQAFLLHFLSYNHLPFEKNLLLPEVLMFVVPLFVPLLGSADFLDHRPDKLVLIYLLVSVVTYFLLLSSSGYGADTNRCLEPLLVLSCVFAARLATAKGVLGGMVWTGALTFVLATVALLSGAFVVPQVERDDFAADDALQQYLHENFAPRTPILGYYAGDPIRGGLDAPITNLWHYSALIRKGLLSDRDILSRINSGGYAAILLDFDLSRPDSSKMADFYTTRSMREAILRSYALATQLKLPPPEFTRFTDGNLYVWVPRRPHDKGTSR
jgi:MFS family permease